MHTRAMRWLLVIALAGCWSSSEPQPVQSRPPVGASCPARGRPPAGRCWSNADCQGAYVECVAKPPGPSLRVTGIGDTYGTDGARCDRISAACPTGEVVHYSTAPNLCKVGTCGPKCTPTSCASDESCDGEHCWPTSCTAGYSCAPDEVCKVSLWTDRHGCTKRCPDFGYCNKFGPPVG